MGFYHCPICPYRHKRLEKVERHIERWHKMIKVPEFEDIVEGV
jgi:hypothetical protein